MSKNDHKVMVGCLLDRVGDHVHWMIRNDASVYMASGTTSNGTEIQIDWLHGRVGTLLEIQGSPDLASWTDATRGLIWISDQSLPGSITRRRYLIDPQPPRSFFRLQANPRD